MSIDAAASPAASLAPRLCFRLATRRDSSGITALLNETFRTPIDVATWEWYAHANPNGPSRVYLALRDGGAIAGVIGFSPVGLRIGGSPVTASYAHHLALNPEFRDTLSYIAFLRYSLKAEASAGAKLTIGPPNRTAYPIHKTLMKWVDFGYLDCLRKLSPTARQHSCCEVRLFAPEFDLFYQSVSNGFAFCVDKGAAWMNWRFCSRPGSPYTVYTAGGAGGLTGYVVLKRWQEPDGRRKAHIMDLHAKNESALHHLIATAEAYAAGCEELNLWAIQGYPYRSFLEAAGFEVSRRQPLLAKSLDGDSVVFPAGNSSLSYGDGDCQY
jgi:hypothetical protein